MLQEAKNAASSLVNIFEENPVLRTITILAVAGTIIVGAYSASVASVIAAVTTGIAAVAVFIIEFLESLVVEVL